ncbi:MAG TPA: FxsA family protein [Cellvibrio sp.]|nr:FxsA family protein [Cellvibrio sp.]
MRLPLLLILVLPVLELWLMIEIGGEVGALAVIAWLGAMIIVGINLFRYLGASSMLRAAQGVRGGVMPAQAMVEGLFKAVGAVLLIVPGFITDFLALLCFIPFIRRLMLKRWLAKIAVSAAARGFNPSGFGANPFKSGSFHQPPGNVYEHQGPIEKNKPTGAGKARAGALIDQQPDVPAAKDHKND